MLLLFARGVQPCTPVNPRVSPRETGFPSPPAILPRSSAVSLPWSNGVLPRDFPLAAVAVRPDTCRFTARRGAPCRRRGCLLPGSRADRLDCAPAPPTMGETFKIGSNNYDDFFFNQNYNFCVKLTDLYVLFL